MISVTQIPGIDRPQRLELAGQVYAIGLIWRIPTNGHGRSGFKEIELDLEPGGAVYCSEADAGEQAGYIPSVVGTDEYSPEDYMGLPSLALTVLLTGVGDGVYILPIDGDKSYVLCIDDGQVVADTDIIVKNPINGMATDKAWVSAAELCQLHQWEPTELDAEAIGLAKPAKSTCIDKVGGGKPSSGNTKLVLVLIAITIVTLGILYKKYAPDEKTVEVIEAQQREETPEEAMAKYRLLTEPAVRGLSSSAFYEAFRGITQVAPAVVNGWQAKDITCSESAEACTIQYDNTGNSSPAEMRAYFTTNFKTGVVIDLAGTTAVARFPAKLSKDGGDFYGELPHTDVQMITLGEIIAGVRRIAVSKMTASGVGEISGFSQKVPVEQRLRMGTFVIQGPISELSKMVSALDHPGFFFSNLKMSETEYKLEGRYVQHQ